MTTYLSRTDATVSRIISASFPSYKGNRIHCQIGQSVQFSGTQWDEGNKNDYVIIRLSDMAIQSIPTAPFMAQSQFHESEYDIPNGYVVVCHSRCKYEHITIFANSADITPMLSPPVELTDDEKIVLVAIGSYVSSYGGVGNYRFVEAKRQTGITSERYETAKSELIGKKFLTKSGAMTIDGRNAIGGMSFSKMGFSFQMA